MYSLWRYVRAMSNASSSAARYVLKVWFHLQPSTGFVRCEITTNIKHVLPAPLLETSTFSPSLSADWRINGSPNLTIASRNGLRRPS